MRFYKVTVDAGEREDGQPHVKWAATQADARAAKKELAAANGLSELSKKVSFQETDVPTDKQGLLAFLNENVRG